jgi:hypothetical protein
MNAATKASLASKLNGTGWLFLAMAGVAFWVGGALISDITQTERFTSEIAADAHFFFEAHEFLRELSSQVSGHGVN